MSLLKSFVGIFFLITLVACSTDSNEPESMIPETETTQDNDDDMNDDDDDTSNDNIFDGDVVLSSQADVDIFTQEQYTEINGSLLIQNEDPNDPIVSLDGLSSLTSIEDTLRLFELSQIESLSGLENIEFVGLTVRIFNLPNLIDISDIPQSASTQNYILDTLPNVTAVPSFEEHTSINLFVVFRLDSITQLNVFPNLISIDNFFRIDNNENLNSLSGFQNLTHIQDSFSIEFNTNLETISLWDSYQGNQFGSFIIKNNALSNVDFLENITQIGGLSIVAGDNDQITDISLSNLNSIDFLKLENLMIADLNNLNSISNIRSLNIRNCNLVNDLDGLSALSTNNSDNDGSININQNDNLNDFCGISNYIINNEIGSFQISGNLFNPTETDFTNGNCSI